ncbi:MAG TPA: hypothetical protein VLY46_10185 [Usitatibacter sp.]|nr:hypothetical protein [Usitatibacter sp.]
MSTAIPAMRGPALAVLAAAAIVATPAARAADYTSTDYLVPGEESFILDLGGIVNQFDTSLRLDGQTTRGSDVNLERNGEAKNLSSFEAFATWRFLSRHRLDLQYFGTKRSGSQDYTGAIDIGDATFPVGANVSVQAKSQFFNADYRYSFAKAPDWEFAGLVGFYGGKFTYDVNATGQSGNLQATYNKTVSTTVPLPLLGVTLDWYPDRQWKVSGQLQGMKANIGDVDGHAYLAGASLEYMLWRNLGIGTRYLYSDVNVDVSKSDFHGNLSWKMNSWSLYAKLAF